MVDRVFTPETLNNLTGKPVLWVDDNPTNMSSPRGREQHRRRDVGFPTPQVQTS
jgi:hypothetical protein